ncbi:dUTP diphosphatase [Candidatus Endowatersipora endosymbiont of Watersipora subatra]|uniref:dUTP diphosphatase n=1 Tax=Candidatus Endowatersipora endosymbiont of Watersipora subatra TaxID=3077946 RepID=UPI00312C9540
MKTIVKIFRFEHAYDLVFPSYESANSAGMDLRAALGLENTIVLPPGRRELIPTGLCLELPQGHEGQVRPRSSLAVKFGITVLNAPGTIDEDYRGEVKIALINLSDQYFIVKHGMRIAQLVVAPVIRVTIEQSTELSDTNRGSGGFGSTGI